MLQTNTDFHQSFCDGGSHFKAYVPGKRPLKKVELVVEISVPRCRHGADHRQARPDYRTDVFHLALSADTSCLRRMRGQHYTAALRAEPETRG